MNSTAKGLQHWRASLLGTCSQRPVASRPRRPLVYGHGGRAGPRRIPGAAAVGAAGEQHGTGMRWRRPCHIPTIIRAGALRRRAAGRQLETPRPAGGGGGEKSIAIRERHAADPTATAASCVTEPAMSRAHRRAQGCQHEERAIHECNTGLMCVGRPAAGVLAQLKNDNAQGEYYSRRDR